MDDMHRMKSSRELVCLTLILLCVVHNSSLTDPFSGKAKLQMGLLKEENDFTEGYEMTFLCLPTNSTIDRPDIVWFVRDSISYEKLYFDDSIIYEGKPQPKIGVKNVLNQLTIKLRRDFTLAQVVCRDLGVRQEAVYRLPKITPTNPIEKVELMTTDLILGRKPRLECRVKVPDEKILQWVMFRDSRKTLNATQKTKLDQNWFHFERTENRSASLNRDDDRSLQCFASAYNWTGIVVSESKRLIVHYFNFTTRNWSKRRFTKLGNSVRVVFDVSANPEPKKEQFSLVQAFASRRRRRNDIVTNTKIHFYGGRDFNIAIEFTPQSSGNYFVQFNSTVLQRSTPKIYVNVSCFHFDRQSEWHNWALKGSKMKFSFWFCANPLSSAQELHTSVVRIPDDESGGLEEIIPLNKEISPFDGSGLYQINVTIFAPSSGLYKVVVQRKKTKVESLSFWVRLTEDLYTTLTTVIWVLAAVLFVITAIFILQRLYNYLYHKYKCVVEIRTDEFHFIRKKVSRNASLRHFYSKLYRKWRKGEDDAESAEKRLLLSPPNENGPFKVLVYNGPKKRAFEVEKHGKRTLRQCGVGRNSQIIISFLEFVRFEYLQPNVSKISETKRLGIGNSFEEIVKHFDNKDTQKVVLQFGYIFMVEGEEHLAIDSGVANKFTDAETAEFVTWDQCEIVYNNFVTSFANLRWSPGLTPRLHCRYCCDFVTLDEKGKMEKLETAPESDDWVVCVRGMQRYFDDEGNKVFIELYDGRYFDCDNGERYGRSKVPGWAEVDKWQAFYLFLKDGAKVPDWCIESDEKSIYSYYRNHGTLLLYRRLGKDLQIENRRLYAKKWYREATSLKGWWRPKAPDEFDQELLQHMQIPLVDKDED